MAPALCYASEEVLLYEITKDLFTKDSSLRSRYEAAFILRSICSMTVSRFLLRFS